MTVLVTNDAVGTLAGSVNNTTQTITLSTGQGALFPSPVVGEFFYATIIRASDGAKEIVKCTGRVTDVLTVDRGQDGTTAIVFAAADRVELRPIRAVHLNYAQLDTANTFVGNQAVTGNITASGDITVGDDLVVTDDASIGGDVSVGGALAVTGNETVSGNLTVTGSILMSSRKVDAINAGAGLLWRQTSVPTGWTKSTTYNNAAIRIVSGTPSQKTDAGDEFTTLFAARTIAALNLPDHTITITDPGHVHTDSISLTTVDATNNINVFYPGAGSTSQITTDSAVTGISAAFGSTARGGAQTSMAFDVNYVDFYLATKDA